jgi:arginine utilization regulatory protein
MPLFPPQPALTHLRSVDFFAVFDALDEGVIIADRSGRVLYYNEAQADIDGLRPANVIGRQIADIYQLNWRDSIICRCLEANAPIIGRLFFYRTFKGKLAHTIHSVFPLHEAGQLIGAVCFVKNYNLLEKVTSGVSTLSPHTRPEHANGTRYRFTDLVGADDAFFHALRMARLAAESDSPVMLFGETGSGKEMFAQSIHNYSPRKERPFVGVNCAAIPDSLLEGILFGTAKGAFTGAVDKIGLFEQANGGTLFLDELNAMPVNLQAKLLRVVQEKRIRRVGAERETPVSVKIVSSVNIPAHRSIREGQLRMDLFYRLAVVYITIPPLREQPRGIETLARHFIYKSNLALGKAVDSISEPVMQFFRSYHWPGNVRELEHCVEGAMNMIGADATLRTAHLPPHFLLAPVPDDGPPLPVHPVYPPAGRPDPPAGRPDERSNRSPADGPAVVGEETDLRRHRQGQESRLIHATLTATGGNVSEAARRLKVSRQLVHYKMRKYGLARDHYRRAGGHPEGKYPLHVVAEEKKN